MKFVVLAATMLVCPVLLAQEPATAAAETNLDLRYRLETVDDDGVADDAEASTLRLRLNYRSKEVNGWLAFVEFDHVAEIGLDDFNSGAGTSSPSRGRFPVVADPDGSDLNQLYVQRALSDRGQLRLGRQRIVLDNVRFVGNVGWRQNEQAYDSVSIRYDTTVKWSLFYAWVANVNRIFGNDVAAGDNDSSHHLLELRRPITGGTLTASAFILDNKDLPELSSNTWSVAWTGQTEVAAAPTTWRLQYARQSDAADNPANYSASYLRADVNVALETINLGLGYESLGADNGVGFATPLATLHGHNGWADQFLATPGAGLEDLFVSVGGPVGRFKWNLIWHDYGFETGGGSPGSELDASLATSFGKRYNLLFKVAAFDGDGRADVTKAWVMFSAGF